MAPPPPFNRYIADDPDIVRIRKPHLLYLAALTFGCMTAVFLIGLYAGRDQGVRAALAEYGGEVARIPVSDPATTALAGAAAVAPTSTDKPVESAAVTTELPAEPVATPQVAEMDFRPEAKVRAGTDPVQDAAVAPTTSTPPTVAAPTASEAVAKKTDEKIDPSSAPTKPTGSWYIQAGAARNEAEALGYVKKFKAAGILAKVEKAEVRGNRYYRVIVGPYAEKSAAEKDIRKVANSKILKSDPFVRLIK